MLITLSIIGFMLLLVIYFFVRSQSMEKELKVYKNQAKIASNQAKKALITVDGMAIELQKMLTERLEAAKRRQLVAGEQYEAVRSLLNQMEKVIMSCSEQGATVSEALDAALKGKTPGVAEIKLFISKQPNEVKLPWSRNDVGSFITTCTNIITTVENPGKTAPEEMPQEAQGQ